MHVDVPEPAADGEVPPDVNAAAAAALLAPAALTAARAGAAAPRTEADLRSEYEALCSKQASGRSAAWAHLEPILLNDAKSGAPKEVNTGR